MATSYQSTFIQGLSKFEINVAEEHLKRTGRKQTSKELILFKALISNPTKDYSIAELETITGSTGGALRVLKGRLFDKVAEALIHDSLINESEGFNKNDRIALKLRKKFILCGVLYLTTRNQSFQIQLELLNQIITVAKKNEIYNILIDALIRKKQIIGLRRGQNEFNKVNKELKFYTDCQSAVSFASDCYCHVAVNESKLFFQNSQLTNFLKKSILVIKADYKRTKSLHIKHYLLILQFAYAEQKKDFHSAVKLSKQYSKLIEHNKAIYKKSRMAIANMNISLYYLFLGNHKLARKHCYIGQKYTLKGTFEYHGKVEHEFYIEFYDAKFDQALKLSNNLAAQSLSDAGPFLKSKYEYFRAYAYFAKRSFKDSLSILIKSSELEKDKTLWNIGLKILIIQTFIELNKFDEASRALESLRKHVERHKKGGNIKQRDLLIIKTLRELEKDGFNYSLQSKTIPKLLKTLAQKNRSTSWEHKTPEMIPFHEWLENR